MAAAIREAAMTEPHHATTDMTAPIQATSDGQGTVARQPKHDLDLAAVSVVHATYSTPLSLVYVLVIHRSRSY